MIITSKVFFMVTLTITLIYWAFLEYLQSVDTLQAELPNVTTLKSSAQAPSSSDSMRKTDVERFRYEYTRITRFEERLRYAEDLPNARRYAKLLANIRKVLEQDKLDQVVRKAEKSGDSVEGDVSDLLGRLA